MKKKLLFVIDSLTIGGAEKSLISLLNLIDSSIYEIDLLLIKRGGDLEKYVPSYINILPVPRYFSSIENKFTFENLYYRIKTSLNLRVNNYKKNVLHSEQVVFKSISRIISPLNKMYDVAIAYSQGMPTYLVANKVKASKKLAWINTDYANTLYDKELDYKSYSKIDKIIAVSEHTKSSVSQLREEYKNKVDLVLDIVDPKMIDKMSREEDAKEFDNSLVIILTVGRLVTAKGYEKAIEVAKLLKHEGYTFKWFSIGEGPERKKLQKLIEDYELQDYFIFLGKKVNPYIYMRNCDIYVQTSIKEGFGLTVSEAKILKRPIVCTSFPTAKEIIQNEVDGLIVDHDIESIYNGVKKYLDEKSFKEKVMKKLDSTEPYSSVNQISNFYNLIEN
ncbi:glycosyltransferase involved in cell wall biosynthesis [Metabacillus crassostreae]|uniref:glycosyltransferase n=1 Tax=Metabacillus crassostreae TaxID=929098 RepID=UPI00195C3146|nr:glycosyltransferase [Metabacillus crassostreae]MBM7604646.1 glycosyltransferase involved in cell wall biosynthesis [Metabacillus crassostreae]